MMKIKYFCELENHMLIMYIGIFADILIYEGYILWNKLHIGGSG